MCPQLEVLVGESGGGADVADHGARSFHSQAAGERWALDDMKEADAGLRDEAVPTGPDEHGQGTSIPK